MCVCVCVRRDEEGNIFLMMYSVQFLFTVMVKDHRDNEIENYAAATS